MAPPWLQSVRSLGRQLGQGALQLLYPGICAVCGAALPPDQADFCDTCQVSLTTDPYPSCPRCATTTGPFAHWDSGCIACRGETYHFERTLRLGPYDGLLRDM